MPLMSSNKPWVAKWIIRALGIFSITFVSVAREPFNGSKSPNKFNSRNILASSSTSWPAQGKEDKGCCCEPTGVWGIVGFPTIRISLLLFSFSILWAFWRVKKRDWIEGYQSSIFLRHLVGQQKVVARVLRQG